MAILAVMRTNSSKNAYQPDESRVIAEGVLNSSKLNNNKSATTGNANSDSNHNNMDGDEMEEEENPDY